MLQGVEGGSIEGMRIRLGVDMGGEDHDHNLLLLDVNNTSECAPSVSIDPDPYIHSKCVD
jgi:hypothetical protein